MTDTTQGQDRDHDGDGGRDEKEAPPSSEATFKKLKGWFLSDYEKQGPWRTQAKEDYGFEAGDQLNEADKAILSDMNRPVVIFNRIGPVVDSVAGQEVGNRQELEFIPRRQGAVQKNEMLTSAARWFLDECDAADEESDSFRDMLTCGMGWTETGLKYEDTPEGAPQVDRTDPLEMVWDAGARKRNLVDKRRVFHIRRDIPIEEAQALCPGDDFEDSDYNATWVDDKKATEDGKPHENDNRFYNKESTGNGEEDSGEKLVTMVRAQWFERVPVHMIADPDDPTGQAIKTLSAEDFKELMAKYKLAGAPMPKSVKGTRKVYKQAYLGAILLEIGDAPCKDHFSFNCMTGKRDRNKNSWFGLVRAMKDPARWSNKWLSQTMHIMNTTSKGGIAAERGEFFDNDAEGEASWAKQDTVTYLKAGALSGANGAKFIQKPVSQFPEASFNLMQFAVTAHRDVSGLNLETLGMQQGAGQAASLDLQRKQSAMTILQPLFDSLRRYRKEQGRLMLYLIENYLSDGRLIKIVGPEGAQYVPLVKQPGNDGNYDVIADESPTSANQKEATWAFLQQILPVIGKMLPPATWLALLKYSPLPTSAQKDITDSIAAEQQQAKPDPEAAKAASDLQASQAKSAADIANAKAVSEAKIQIMRDEAAAKREIAVADAQHAAMTGLMTAPPIVGPDGQAMPNHGADAAQLVMSIVQQMRNDMAGLAQALNTPKRLIRDPNTGELIGIAPMGAN
ncbi:hypothetical protein ONR75_15825 [Rhodopseudomonas sp. P2A-2r]|uniref:portal protein n=1 Tax=Rhodopseudomonas sp. P2A-2r TaxID=2991972 RepID=UPI0022344509|nr:hypothetical protein [Rhodopseudomonas sp. P2A-2r]UZE51899.1 hypothetical protein ONR75_15825 [Rhodopseudomonas sp. P2A-2r]